MVRGAANMLDDLRNNGGWPSQVDTTGFEVGVNMAATPGTVVYRSDLIELIQYEPQTDEVHEVPLLFCPPWINKYYIMDLAPGKSLIEWAVAHGHTCFAISYRNPDAVDARPRLRGLPVRRPARRDRGGPRDHRRARGQHSCPCASAARSPPSALAHNAASGDRSINVGDVPQHPHRLHRTRRARRRSPTRRTVAGLEKQMAKKGYLDSDKMARTFDALRANDLVFAYVVNNWLLGKNAAGVRPAGVERRQHPDAGQDALASICGRAT